MFRTPPGHRVRAALLESSRQSLETSGQRTRSLADDRIVISLCRNSAHIDKAEPGASTMLARIKPPTTSTVSVAQILTLASLVSQHRPDYDLMESNCFYYGRAIFDVTRDLMDCKDHDVETSQNFRFMKFNALQWGPAHIVKGHMADKVAVEFKPEKIKELYETALAAFLKSVEERKAVCGSRLPYNHHPLT